MIKRVFVIFLGALFFNCIDLRKDFAGLSLMKERMISALNSDSKKSL